MCVRVAEWVSCCQSTHLDFQKIDLVDSEGYIEASAGAWLNSSAAASDPCLQVCATQGKLGILHRIEMSSAHHLAGQHSTCAVTWACGM